MTNLTSSAGWDAVPQIDANTPVLGGPGGPANAQAQALLNRTEILSKGVIRPEIFGAVGDGMADDTEPMQEAIDAWTVDPTKEIYISGQYNIVGTILVPNIETLNPERRLKFVGGGTLIKNNAGYLFDKPAGQLLQTGHIYFFGIRFLGATLAGQTWVLNGDNIIRTHFIGCFGIGINCAVSSPTGYLQTITHDKATTWRKWSGYLFDCGYNFDLELGGVYEVGDAVLITRLASADPACNGLRVSGNIEGMSGVSGPAINVGVCWATIISVRYCEQNAGGDFNFNGGTGFHKGLTITGCGFQPTAAQIADPNYYPVVTGKGAINSITLIGNASTHNLFDVAVGNQSAVDARGNYVPSGKNEFSPTSPRLFLANGTDYKVSLLPGFGVSLMGYYSALGFENTRATVGGESVVTTVSAGSSNPQSSPADYPQKNWVRGSIVINANAQVASRQYGAGVVHDALIVGWQCVSSGTPGQWREIAIMLPY